MSLRLSVLGSSSSGNCTFVSTSKVRILLDAGFSRAQTAKCLSLIGESLETINAIVVSHEHSDHTKGLSSLLDKHNIPVYIAGAALDALQPAFTRNRVEMIQAGVPVIVGDLKISPFSIPHDAADPLAFVFEAEGLRIAHVTDLGYLTELTLQRLKGCDAIVLESNHDLEMLKSGPYPWFLKQRIMSKQGHLSNEVTARFFGEDFDGQARHVVLAHLSQNNNHPDIARMVSAEALEKRGFNLENLWLASRSIPSPIIEL